MAINTTNTHLPECEFDAATHTYRIDGNVVPSVTQVLREAGFIDARWYTEEGRARGEAIHIVTELYDKGTLREDADLGELAGYLAAWKKFLADTGAEVVENECTVWHTTLKYAGTMDRLVIWNKVDAIGDIKGGGVGKWEPIQTAAYAGARDPRRPPPKRFAIHLRDNGKYTLKEHTNFARDFDVFRGALIVANWKREHLRTGDQNGKGS